MNARPNYPLLELERYLKKLPNSVNMDAGRRIGEELLRLMFAYARRKEGLHLRWNRSECRALLFLTVDELYQKKGKDPALNKAYKAIQKLDPVDTLTKEALLDMAERVLKGQTAKNRQISRNKGRKRTEHIFKGIVREVVEDFPKHNHIEIRNKAISEANKKKLIYEVDEEFKVVIFHEYLKFRNVSFPTIRGWIDDLKPKKSSRK
jgi:hypothetical protein